MSIRSKLLLTLLLAGIACVAVTGTIAYYSGKESLTQAVTNQLTGIRRSRASQIETYFQKIRDHIRALGSYETTAMLMQEFTREFNQLDRSPLPAGMHASVETHYRNVFLPKLQEMSRRPVTLDDYLSEDPVAWRLQQAYIVDNPHPLDRKQALFNASAYPGYGGVHARFHQMFLQITQVFGYHDIFLIEPTDGRIIYSVQKEADFGTSLLTGPFRHTGLARVVAKALAATEPGAVFITDFEGYAPSFGAPAAFVAAPIMVNGRKLGVVAAQLSIRDIDNVVSGNQGWERDGLGQTGDSGIVGSDHLMRSTTRKFLQNPEAELAALRSRNVSEDILARIRAYGTTALQREVRLESVEAALAGKDGTLIQTSSSGEQSIVSYMPLAIPGFHWSFATRIGSAEALASIGQLRQDLLRWGLVLVGIMSLAALGLTRGIVDPLNRLAQAAHRLGSGQETPSEQLASGDEVGRLEKEFDLMVKSVTTDIEQKTAESRKLQTILDNSPVGVAISVDAVLQFVNPRFVELTGVRAGEPAPNFYRNPADRETVLKRLETDGLVRDLEIDSWGPNQEPRTYLVTYSRVEFEGRDAILGWITDVSLLKKIEDELKRVNFLSDTALELTRSGYWHIDFADPEHYRSSERLRVIFGEEPKDGHRYHLVNEWQARIVAVDSKAADATAERFYGAIEGRYERYDTTYPYQRPADGRVIWCRAMATLVRHPDGRARLMHGVVQDITEQVMAQQALAAEHARLKLILDTAPVGVGIATDGFVRLANPRVTELASIRVGSPTSELYTKPADRDYLLGRLKTEAMVQDYEMQSPGLNGQTRDLLVTYIRTEFQGRPGVLGWLVDVTALKKIERELSQSYERLRDLEKLRDNLVHMIIHDMRSPLAVISGRLELMQMRDQAILSEKAIVDLQGAMSGARNLIAMTNDLLDVSRLEAGKFPLSLAPCDLTGLAGKVGTELTGMDSTRKIRVEAAGPVEVMCDAGIIHRVLVNLVNNGIKHTPAGTALDIRVVAGSPRARMEVCDRGPGVPLEIRGRIFEKFGTTETGASKKYHSAGLGLAFCRLAVEAHEGAIGVGDREGGGSVFWFELPVTGPAATAPG